MVSDRVLRRRQQQAVYQRTDAGKAKCWKAKLKYRYGITVEQWDWMFEQQEGLCYLCGEDESLAHHSSTGEIMRLAVDHDHSCPNHDPKRACPQCIRSLLCYNCNRMVGRAEHSPRLRSRFADYLERRPLLGRS